MVKNYMQNTQQITRYENAFTNGTTVHLYRDSIPTLVGNVKDDTLVKHKPYFFGKYRGYALEVCTLELLKDMQIKYILYIGKKNDLIARVEDFFTLGKSNNYTYGEQLVLCVDHMKKMEKN